jgi:hypothetical protein
MGAVVFVMHDSTLARTTNCTGSAREDGFYDVPYYGYLEFCDAGMGEKVPVFRDMLDIMVANPDKVGRVYLGVGFTAAVHSFLHSKFREFCVPFCVPFCLFSIFRLFSAHSVST